LDRKARGIRLLSGCSREPITRYTGMIWQSYPVFRDQTNEGVRFPNKPRRIICSVRIML
jgi:hypothetical protein